MSELTQILEYKKFHGQIVVPVFYKVDPFHVRNQTGSYKKAFINHEQDLMHKKVKLKKWKASLTEAANLVEWDSQYLSAIWRYSAVQRRAATLWTLISKLTP